jgi:uncharacterized protein (UPF0218 family)
MPEDLALLSAYLYAQDGAAILFPTDGVVVKLSNQELKLLKVRICKQFRRSFQIKSRK